MNIRQAVVGDVPALQRIYAPYVLESAISFEEDVPSVEEMGRRMAAAHFYLVAERDDAICGYAYCGPHRSREAYRHAADVSVYVDQSAQGSGIGKALYAALFAHAGNAGLHRLYAGIALPNDASIGLHEHFGFRHIGTFSEVGWKFDRWHDVGWWEKRL